MPQPAFRLRQTRFDSASRSPCNEDQLPWILGAVGTLVEISIQRLYLESATSRAAVWTSGRLRCQLGPAARICRLGNT